MKPHQTGALFSFLLLGASSLASAQVSFSHLVTLDLSSTAFPTGTRYIGNNPSALAWDGTNAWIGGYNQSGSAAPTAIIQISNVLTNPTFGTPFGTFTTNNLRGITSLAVQGNLLAASLDNGAGSGDSVRIFNASTGTLNWRIGTSAGDNSRRGNGVAFDPGFNGADAGSGVAYLSIGSGRRHLLDSSAGTYKFGQNAGMIINLNPVSTTWRDLAFDPDTGDLYARESNRLAKARRTGDNSVAGASTLLGSLPQASAVDNQNLAFVDSLSVGNFLLLNDRSTPSAGQSFFNVVKAISTSGAPVALNFGSFAPALGNGAYDFAWHADSYTLAISDFANRRLYVFAAVPEPGSILLLFAGLGSSAAFLLRRRRSR
jgi:hypothetical protein